MSCPSFKMNSERLKKLTEYLQKSNQLSKKSVRSQINNLRQTGSLNQAYYFYCEQGCIEDQQLFPVEKRTVSFGSSSDCKKLTPEQIEKLTGREKLKQESKPPLKAPEKPSKVKSKKIGRLIKFDPETIQELKQKADDMGCSYSYLVRCAVKQFLQARDNSRLY